MCSEGGVLYSLAWLDPFLSSVCTLTRWVRKWEEERKGSSTLRFLISDISDIIRNWVGSVKLAAIREKGDERHKLPTRTSLLRKIAQA